MSAYRNLTVSDLPESIANDIIQNFNRIDQSFGYGNKHEHWLMWKHLIPHCTADVPANDLAEFLELEGRQFLMPMPRHFHHLLRLVSAHFSKDDLRATIFFAIDPEKGPNYLGSYFTGVLAIADLYEKDGFSFYLGRYLHSAYLVGKEEQSLMRQD